MTAIKEKLEEHFLCDVAILSHGFTSYMRDYDVVIEAKREKRELGNKSETYLCRFTHCPEVNLISKLENNVWAQSWDDLFIDYGVWESNGSPGGFVWGVNWALAYSGFIYVDGSELALKWSKNFEKEMHEVVIETNAYKLQIIFHEFNITKVKDEVSVINQVIIPLGNK